MYKVCPKCNGDQHLSDKGTHWQLKCIDCDHIVKVPKKEKAS